VNYSQIANEARAKIVELSQKKKVPHLGSSLSCVDILIALYFSCKLNLNVESYGTDHSDRIIFSKGHGAAALYTVLAKKGFFPESLLDSFAELDSPLAEHPKPFGVKGVELATGSLGHGLSVGLGLAKGAQILNKNFKVCVLMSDGECNEGAVWEAAMLAPSLRLGNLIAIVDFNKWQATGRSREIMSIEPFCDKWTAFGWNAVEVDGHDIDALTTIINRFKDGNDTKPVAVVAHTIKGKGISFMEDDNNWHYRIPTEEEFLRAKKELGVS